MDDLYTVFGSILRSKRSAANLTQEQLASRVSLGRTSITNIEKGRQQITLQMLFDLAAALHVPAKELLPEMHSPLVLTPGMEKEVSAYDADTQSTIRDFLART